MVTLLQVKDPEARDWYEKEAIEQTWSVRTLQRNISSQYYYRMLRTQKKEIVESEMKELTVPYQSDKLEFIKNPGDTEAGQPRSQQNPNSRRLRLFKNNSNSGASAS